MYLKALWWFQDLEGKFSCPRCDPERDLINCDWKWICGLVGLGVLLELCSYMLLPQRKKCFSSKAKQKLTEMAFCLAPQGQTLWTPNSCPFLLRGPLQRKQTLEESNLPLLMGSMLWLSLSGHMKYFSNVWETWSLCIPMAVGLSLMPAARNCSPASSVKLNYRWLLAYQVVHSFERSLNSLV